MSSRVMGRLGERLPEALPVGLLCHSHMSNPGSFRTLIPAHIGRQKGSLSPPSKTSVYNTSLAISNISAKGDPVSIFLFTEHSACLLEF